MEQKKTNFKDVDCRSLQVRLIHALRGALIAAQNYKVVGVDVQLCDLCGLTRSAFSRISTGTVQASPIVLRTLCFLCSVHVSSELTYTIIREWIESLPDDVDEVTKDIMCSTWLVKQDMSNYK